MSDLVNVRRSTRKRTLFWTVLGTVCLTIVFLVLLNLGSPVHLDLSSTHWVVPKNGSNQVTFNVTTFGKQLWLHTFGRYDGNPSTPWPESMVLLFRRESGYTIFPDNDGSSLPVGSLSNIAIRNNGDSTKITLIGDLYRNPDGKRYLLIGQNRYPLDSTDDFGVLVSFAGYQESNSIYVKVTNE
jgi:hypothetical protein